MSVTAVVLNWCRPRWLRWVVLPALARHPLVDEIVVSHGRRDTAFRYRSRKADIVHRHDWELNERYSLALRFVAAREARNEAVLIVDDDLRVAPSTITALKAAHDEAPLTIHGVFGRHIGEDYSYRFEDYALGEAPIVLTRCLMMHRSYADLFLEMEPRAAHLIVRGSPKWNGEDIFLSLLSIKRTGSLPRAYALPFKNVWRMHRGGVSRHAVPMGDPVKLAHRPYRSWFIKEAARLLEVEDEIGAYLERRRLAGAAPP